MFKKNVHVVTCIIKQDHLIEVMIRLARNLY